MKKAVILTYAPITEEEQQLLRNSDVFKIACNDYRADCKPNIRLTADNIVDKCLECDTCPVVSLNYDLEKPRVINGCHYPDRHSSLLSCIDYLILNGYLAILLVATNTCANNQPIKMQFQQDNRDGVNSSKRFARIYKYSNDGVFDVPTLSIKEFLEMNEENLILGIKEDDAKTMLLESLTFSEATKYEISTKGCNNASIETGDMLLDILPMQVRQQILCGETEIEYNGMIIKRLVPVNMEKPINKSFDEIGSMTYNEMQKFVKEHSLRVASNKKDELIRAIKEFKGE